MTETTARRRPRFLTLLAALAALLSAAPGPAAAAPEAGRIVAIGDVHGDLESLTAVLRETGLIDAEGRWSGGTATLVQTGDLTDRGTRVRAVLDLIRRLQKEAPASGGRVVALLGNHELNNLVGYLDFKSTPLPALTEVVGAFADGRSEERRRRAYKQWKRWGGGYPACAQLTKEQWMALHPPGFVEYMEALGPDGEYGRWLRGLPVVARIDDTIFMHGGVSPDLPSLGIGSLEELSPAIRRELDAFDALKQQLVEEGLILPFFMLPEIYCAVDAALAAVTPPPDEAPQGNESPKQAAERRRLQALRDRLPGPERSLIFHNDGPVWFRGFAYWDDEEGPRLITDLAARHGFAHAVVGHTPQTGGIGARFGGRVFLIDTAMVFGTAAGGRAAALEIEGGRFSAVYPGERVLLHEGPPKPLEAPTETAVESSGETPAEAPVETPVEAPAEPPAEAPPAAGPGIAHGTSPAARTFRLATRFGLAAASLQAVGAQTRAVQAVPAPSEDPGGERRWLGPDGTPLPFRSDEEVLDFLRTAKVASRKQIPIGVTRPQKLLMEKDGVRAHAVFRFVEVEERGKRLTDGRRVSFFLDSYENEVAAYWLSRLLGMDNLPPAVTRRLKGQRGSVQIWVEKSILEKDRQERGIQPPDPLKWRHQTWDMWVFDNLINNIDRNQGNMLIDAEWRLWLIDHTRAFARVAELPNPERLSRCSRRLWHALTTVDDATITEQLRPHLGVYEIEALLVRRGKLVEYFRQKIAERGESKVLFTFGEPSVTITPVSQVLVEPASLAHPARDPLDPAAVVAAL